LKVIHNKLIRNSLVLIWLLTGNAYAYELPVAELDKIGTAQRLAARVYQETKDAAGATRVLEEAGVGRLEKGRPSNMTLKAYLDAIEAYAGYLALTAESDDAAAEYLKIVIKTDASRVSAYRSLGELYYRRFQQKPDPQYRRIYAGAFTNYVEHLLADNIRTALPQHIIEVVYPQARDICLLTRHLHAQDRLHDLDILFNPEREVSELNLADPQGIHTLLGPSFAGFLQTSNGPITHSTIDIDNDGHIELRFSANITTGCQRDLFYKKFANQTALLSNTLLDEYFRGVRICAGSALQIARINHINYLIEVHQQQNQRALKVLELRPSGEYVQHCQISPPTILEQNLVMDCRLPVCKHLAGNINKIITAEGQVGKEWLVSDVRGQAFSAKVTSDLTLKPFIESPHQYLADLDNDGSDELIARLWLSRSDGKLEYQYRLFKMTNGQWQPWNLPSPDTDAGPGPWQWFFIESYEGSNYIVAYTAGKGPDAELDPDISYKITVYHLSRDQLSRLGEIRTHQNLQ
jgi:hypothetical protein